MIYSAILYAFNLPIPTNSVILIGRLSPTLGYNTRRKVLGAACAKALEDNFLPARVTALMDCMACATSFDVEELAGKVMELVAGALVDKEKHSFDPFAVVLF